ncbi:MAG TPA: hypothetical protein VG271_16880 [Beijerinckiaceae bacterium]|jgi:hypothetical protein|nr:hypothetical protein [Beijerinckiaceae bacterium]
MSASRAVVRLWIVGTLVWIGFWIWNFSTHCLRADDGSLWCPAISGDAIVRTDRLHMAYVLFGPPGASFAAGLICLWAVRATHRQLGAK